MRTSFGAAGPPCSLELPRCFGSLTNRHRAEVEDEMRTLFTIGVVALALTGCERNHSNRVEPQRAAAPAAAPITSRGGQQSFADIVDRVAPAVVTIRSERRVRAPQQFPFFNDPMLREFFGLGRGRMVQPRDEV